MMSAQPVYSCVRDLNVNNQRGIHARAAAQLVALTRSYRSRITISNGRESVSDLSIMNLLLMNVPYGSEVRVMATGLDAENAIEAVADLFEKKFFDEEFAPANRSCG